MPICISGLVEVLEQSPNVGNTRHMFLSFNFKQGGEKKKIGNYLISKIPFLLGLFQDRPRDPTTGFEPNNVIIELERRNILNKRLRYAGEQLSRLRMPYIGIVDLVEYALQDRQCRDWAPRRIGDPVAG